MFTENLEFVEDRTVPGQSREYAICPGFCLGHLVLGHFCPVKKRSMRFVLFWKKTLCHLCYPSNSFFALFVAGTCHTHILGYYSLHSISNPSIRFSNRLFGTNGGVDLSQDIAAGHAKTALKCPKTKTGQIAYSLLLDLSGFCFGTL